MSVASHKLFKGSHRIQRVKVKVEATDTLPSLKQRQSAVYSFIPTSGSVSSLWHGMEKQIPSDIDTKPQEVPPLVAVHSDHPTSGPPVLLDVDEHQCVSKTLSPSYITVSGLTDSISVEDIVAYFQSARCGGGTVTEVVYVDQRKSVALVGINGLELNCELMHDDCTVVCHWNLVLFVVTIIRFCTAPRNVQANCNAFQYVCEYKATMHVKDPMNTSNLKFTQGICVSDWE